MKSLIEQKRSRCWLYRERGVCKALFTVSYRRRQFRPCSLLPAWKLMTDRLQEKETGAKEKETNRRG